MTAQAIKLTPKPKRPMCIHCGRPQLQNAAARHCPMCWAAVYKTDPDDLALWNKLGVRK